jgi:hypothetical protein
MPTCDPEVASNSVSPHCVRDSTVVNEPRQLLTADCPTDLSQVRHYWPVEWKYQPLIVLPPCNPVKVHSIHRLWWYGARPKSDSHAGENVTRQRVPLHRLHSFLWRSACHTWELTCQCECRGQLRVMTRRTTSNEQNKRCLEKLKHIRYMIWQKTGGFLNCRITTKL